MNKLFIVLFFATAILASAELNKPSKLEELLAQASGTSIFEADVNCDSLALTVLTDLQTLIDVINNHSYNDIYYPALAFYNDGTSYITSCFKPSP